MSARFNYHPTRQLLNKIAVSVAIDDGSCCWYSACRERCFHAVGTCAMAFQYVFGRGYGTSPLIGDPIVVGLLSVLE